MADPLPSPPSTPPLPPDPKPPTPAAGKSPKKRKTTTTAGAGASSPANKRPNPNRDVTDTATSKRKVIIDPDNVDVDDIEVLEGLLDYHSRKGVFPFETPADMNNFLRPWLILRFGNEDGWKTKIETVKNKFTKDSVPIEDGERKEFDLWMKIWGNREEDRDQN